VTLGEESASRRDISLNFTAEVSVYGTFVRAVESSQKVCTECIQRITVGASKNKVVNMCRNEECMAIDLCAPHAALKTHKDTSLGFEIGAHGGMPGTGSTWHAVQRASKLVDITIVFCEPRWWRYVDLTVVSIPRKEISLHECLADVHMIAKHMVLSCQGKDRAETASMWHRAESIFKIANSCVILSTHMLALND
jgi:hypothetical protein